jgi:hypothetical protein
VSGDRYHLEVVVEQMTLGEGLGHAVLLRYRLPFVLVREQRRGDPVRGESSLVTMVEVLTRDAPELLDRPGVGLQAGRAVDEQVAAGAPQHEGPDVERRRERQRLRRRGVQAFELGFHYR